MIIDIHCHYAFTQRRASVADRFSFEPASENGQPEQSQTPPTASPRATALEQCETPGEPTADTAVAHSGISETALAFDSCLAPRVLRRPMWRLWQRMLGFDPRLRPGPELDRLIEQWHWRHTAARGTVDRVVLLAFDAYHDNDGRRLPFPSARHGRGSDMYTSNTLIRAACRAGGGRYLFGASVHPYRENAIACVDEVFAAGACLMKWMPLHQNIDCRDERTKTVLRRCAEIGLPLLLHCGPEFTLATQHREYESVEPLLDALRELRRDGCMPTVIVAHVATPVLPWGSRRSYRMLVDALLGEFADAPLYADISALTAWTKIPWLRKLARMQELHPKLVFGTDFPVPIATLRLWRDLGRDCARVAAEPSWPQRALDICRLLGFNEIVFHRAASLLPNVNHFAP